MATTAIEQISFDYPPLTEVESSVLGLYEATIERGLETFVEVGQAFMAIRDGRLYRATHRTFEDYLRERWQMSRPRAYQLMDSAQVAANLSTTVDTPPTSERQVRPLAALEPDDQRTAWSQAVAESDGEQPTAAKVEEVTKSLGQQIAARRREREETVTKAPSGDEIRRERAELAEMREQQRLNGIRNGKIFDVVRAIETLNEPGISLPEIAAEICRMDSPDKDWVGQAERALQHLKLLVKEIDREESDCSHRRSA
jgi:hypothetical protein